MRLANALERKVGYGLIASVRLSTDQDSGRSKGFAHVDFFTPEQALKALESLQGVRIEGREIRVDMKKRVGDYEPMTAPRDWGDSSAR
jgi:nucleolin